MLDDIKQDASNRMQKCVDSLSHEYQRLRTGRASAGLLEHIMVAYYGNETPLKQVANVVVEDARTLSISPWEKNMVGPVEKAIMNSNLGITPNTAGTTIRVIMPPMTEQRRKEMVKVLKAEAETARVSIRNVRRDAMDDIKELLKEKMIGEDDQKRAEVDIQKLTDKFIADIEVVLAAKEKEVLSV